MPNSREHPRPAPGPIDLEEGKSYQGWTCGDCGKRLLFDNVPVGPSTRTAARAKHWMKCAYCEAVDLYQMDEGSVAAYHGRKAELKEMQQIVKAYAQALEAPPDGVLRDVATLPYPKGRIKQALITIIRQESHRETRDHLMSAYVALGDWQDTEHADPTTVITESTALLEQLRSLGL